MPHQCTNCGKAFADGSKQMLSGCPQCGGNKFQFKPKGAIESGTDGDGAADTGSPESDAVSAEAGGSGADQDGSPARESAPADASPSPRSPEEVGSTDEPESATAPAEDRAQADARSGVVSEDELSTLASEVPDRDPDQPGDTAPPPDADGEVIEAPEDERPDLDELRQELNDQFESIKIVDRGQYELNLMELYDREEYIISLREDGRYVIEVPETWRNTPSDG